MQKAKLYIVRNAIDFLTIVGKWDKNAVAADVETKGKVATVDGHLLGVSLAPANVAEAIYIPIEEWDGSRFRQSLPESLVVPLIDFLSSSKLVGHNFTYDKSWLDWYFLGNASETNWIADTRLMYHMAAAPAGPRPYGLKDAQTEILGWDERGDKELEKAVAEAGGKLKNGDHYLAPTDVLGRYAALDAYSTIELYKHLSHFFDGHDYWDHLRMMMRYNALVEANTRYGVAVEGEGLGRAHKRLLGRKEAAKKRFMKLLKPEIDSLEEDWKDRKLADYKREYNKIHYLAHPEKWRRINLNSDPDKRELFFEKLKLPVVETTDSGLPSASADALKVATRGMEGRLKEAFDAYFTYEKATTLTSNFSGPYLDSAQNGRLHPGFNICGTVSYRLSGFKPYLLNAPFDEKLILKNLHCDDGWGGVHADLAAVEPTITAHYSDDPSLVKVFRDGLGDIYLDLALTLFPHDKELQEGYIPTIPITKEVKERFARQRKIAKVIQLAVQYTGTKTTVAKNLNKEGIATSLEEADGYVKAYWRKFRKVAEFNYRLRETNRKQGYLRNVIGRIIRVPDPDYKDLPNRFIQSSGHDVLILWVLRIYELCKEWGISIRPILLDCHDSTSNQCPLDQRDALRRVYLEALRDVNTELGLSVQVKCEVKYFSTLAGLKADE